jgi:hypothetical protein
MKVAKASPASKCKKQKTYQLSQREEGKQLTNFGKVTTKNTPDKLISLSPLPLRQIGTYHKKEFSPSKGLCAVHASCLFVHFHDLLLIPSVGH